MKQYQRLLLCLLLCPSLSWSATSKQYVAPESQILFADSAQAENATWTLSNLLTLSGRVSAQYDRGAGSHAGWYKWRCWAQLTGTNIVGAIIEYYIVTSDGTRMDGELGTADAAFTTEKRRNLIQMGLLVVDQTTTNTIMTASGLIYVPDRYISLAVWNATTLPFKTDTGVHGCSLIPMPPEQQ